MADIFRKSCYLATTLVLLYALLISTGRVLTAFPDQFQALINETLEPHGIHVEGVRASWRRSNPVIEAARVELPFGTLENSLLEVAVIESLIRFQFVANRLSIEDLQLEIELQDQEVDLNIANLISQVEAGFEWVRHTDEINVTGTIDVSRHDVRQSWSTRLQAVNRGGIHRYRAGLQQQSQKPTVEIQFVAEAVDTLLNLRTGDFQMKLLVSNFPLDFPFLTGRPNLPEFTVSGTSELEILQNLTQGHATISATKNLDMASELRIQSAMRGTSGEALRYEISSASINSANSTAQLPAIRLAVDENSITGALAPTQLREMLVAVVDFVNTSSESVAWVRELDLNAMLSDGEFVVDSSGIHWSANLRSLTGNRFGNVPAGFISRTSLHGNLNQLLYEVNNANSSLFFGSYFEKAWNFATVSGTGLVHFQDNELRMNFDDLMLNLDSSETPINLNENIDLHALFSRADGQTEFNELIQEPVNAHLRGAMRHKFGGDPNYNVALLIESKSSLIPSTQVMDFVPTALVSNLTKWEAEYVDEASFYGTTVAYLTYRDDVVSELTRELLLEGSFTNAKVTYDPAWPAIENLDGVWHATADQVEIHAESATTQNTELTTATATFPLQASESFNVQFEATANTNEVLKFVHASELQNWLPTIEQSWHGSGLVAINGNLNFPLQRAETEHHSDEFIGNHQVDFRLDDVSLVMPNLAMEVNEINGTAQWRSPYHVETQLDSGKFFDRPMVGSIETTIRDSTTAIEFRVSSEISFDNAAGIAGLDLGDMGSGETDFHANLVIFPDAERAEELFVATDLIGLDFDLMTPFRPELSVPYPIAFQLALGFETNQLTIQSHDVNGWLTLMDGSSEVMEGAIALGQPTTLPSRIPNKVHVSGSIESWTYDPADDALLDTEVVFTNLEVERLTGFNTQFSDVRINGTYDSEKFDLAVSSNEFSGTLVSEGDGFYTEIDASRLLWSLNEDSSENQLDSATLQSINPIKFSIDELLLKSEDEPAENWGEWAFTVIPRNHGLEIADLSAQTRGLEISALQALQWNYDTNETYFNGRIHGEDLGNILQAWDFDASAESESFDIEADIKWVGSPFDIDIERTSGRIQLKSERGRFINVDQGGDVLRLVSLLNFSKILNRLTLDFKDVTQAGLHFDEAAVEIQLEDGLMMFTEPLVINGPSARLNLSGTVDTRTGELDSDLQVRIPLHKGLQTAATTLAAMNPPATVSLLLGTWLISEPIKALLTANYDITGNLDNPIITRVNVASSQVNTN